MLAMADGRRLQLWQAATPDTPIHPFKEFLQDLSDMIASRIEGALLPGSPCVFPRHTAYLRR
jgi:hypothetical protein